jgi:hypothetical protein
MLKKTAIAAFAVITAFSVLEFGAGYLASGIVAPGQPAEARIGRPLTPVSVAGVGRRTVRRCAVGVYYC